MYKQDGVRIRVNFATFTRFFTEHSYTFSLSVCWSVYLPFLSVLTTFLSVYLSYTVCTVCRYLCVNIRLSVHLSVCLLAFPYFFVLSVSVCLCMSVSLSFCLYIYLYICLSVPLFVYRTVELKSTHMCPYPTPPPPIPETEVNMNLMPPVDVLFIKPLGLELTLILAAWL